MVFGSRQNLRNLPDFKISFRDTELQPCAQVGNLGVVFDGTLSWEAHVSELSRRCMGVLIGLSHARQCLPDGVLKTIVTALVISRVQYCLTVYGNGSQKTSTASKKFSTSPLGSSSAAENLTTYLTFAIYSVGCPQNSWPTITPS